MDSFPQHNPRQASHTKPTIEEVNNWKRNELLEWIQQKKPELLKGDKFERFKAASISGHCFVIVAGDVEFFENSCNLPIGASLELADLSREIAGWKPPV
jgi:hypothetical protein